jgi:hypothetical protein
MNLEQNPADLRKMLIDLSLNPAVTGEMLTDVRAG